MDGRKKRRAYDTPHHAHALTFSVVRRPHPLLPGVAEALLAVLDAARRRLDFERWAFVVMPEHAHVVLRPRQEVYSMADINRTMESPSAQAIFALHPRLREGCRIERRDRPDEFRFW